MTAEPPLRRLRPARDEEARAERVEADLDDAYATLRTRARAVIERADQS